MKNRSERSNIVVLFIAVLIVLPAVLVAMYKQNPLYLPILSFSPVAAVSIITIPEILSVTFIFITLFRLHEVFCILYYAKIPLLLAVLVFFATVTKVINSSLKFFWTEEFTWLALYVVFVFLSVAFSSWLANSLTFVKEIYLKILFGFFSFIWLVQEKKYINLFFVLVIFMSAFVSFITLKNMFYGHGLMLSRATLGMSANSLIGDPNDLASTLILPLGLCITLAFLDREEHSWLMFVFVAILITSAILATKSRGGFLAMSALFFMLLKHYFQSYLKSIFFICVLIAVMFSFSSVRERLLPDKDSVALASYVERKEIALTGVIMALRNPLTGVGIDNFTTNYYAYTPYWKGRARSPHSIWVQVLAETGYVGFMLFCGFISVTLLNLRRARKVLESFGIQNQLYAQVCGVYYSLIAYLVAASFLSVAYYWAFYILHALAIIMSHYVLSRQDKPKQLLAYS